MNNPTNMEEFSKDQIHFQFNFKDKVSSIVRKIVKDQNESCLPFEYIVFFNVFLSLYFSIAWQVANPYGMAHLFYDFVSLWISVPEFC